MIERQQGDSHRSAAVSYQELLDREKVSVPESLRTESNPYMGSEDLPMDRYIKREFHDLEMKKLWPFVWQMACREEEIPEVGDLHVYDIGIYSFIVVRVKPNLIKAFYNSCLHRGRQLKDCSGKTKSLRCPFHGFTWNLDGSFKSCPTPWDFPHFSESKTDLPEVKVDIWGGFVFINMDENSMPLKEYLGVVDSHFERWPLARMTKAVHVQKAIPVNWKVAHEAFIESLHAFETHHHLTPYCADENSQYDTFGPFISRTITPLGSPSPLLKKKLTDQDVVNFLTSSSDIMESKDDSNQLPPGVSAREFIAQSNRESIESLGDIDLGHATNSELLDAILYSVFPNFAPWAGFNGNIIYRFRPNGDNHNSCIMDIMLLSVFKGDRPAPVPVHVLSENEKFTDAAELGALGMVFDQDMDNLPMVQKGMAASYRGHAVLGNYQESRIRHFRQTIQKFLYTDRTDCELTLAADKKRPKSKIISEMDCGGLQ